MNSKIALCLILFVASLHAEVPLLAVLPVKVEGADARKLFTREDISYMSDAIRAEGSRVLGGQVQILSQLQIEKLVMANAQECSGAGCFAGFLKVISADYGLQPTVRFAAGKLRLTLELASNESTLGMREQSGVANVKGKNMLIESSIALSSELFQQLMAELGMASTGTQNPKKDMEIQDIHNAATESAILDDEASVPELLKDSRDGQEYTVRRIGKQVWLGRNMNWKSTGSLCYDELDANCDQYGRLYNAAAAGLACPKGWHLPTDQEWMLLETTLGMSAPEARKNETWRGTDQGGQLKPAEYYGTDQYGFTALMGGQYALDATHILAGVSGYWWTATPDGKTNSFYRYMGLGLSQIGRGSMPRTAAFSVRCVRNPN